jgi:hypothetical protein
MMASLVKEYIGRMRRGELEKFDKAKFMNTLQQKMPFYKTFLTFVSRSPDLSYLV